MLEIRLSVAAGLYSDSKWAKISHTMTFTEILVVFAPQPR